MDSEIDALAERNSYRKGAEAESLAELMVDSEGGSASKAMLSAALGDDINNVVINIASGSRA